MTKKVSKYILERDESGHRMFVKLATERLTEGRLCVRDKMTKRSSKHSRPQLKCHDRNECWRKASKDQRGAWTVARLIVISRSQPQLDPKECIGTYEFGVIPLSLFASDGTVFLAYDKAKILHHLEPLFSNEQLAMHTPAMKTSKSIASNNEYTNIWKHQRVHILQM